MYGQQVQQTRPKQHKMKAVKCVFQEYLGSVFVSINALQFGQVVDTLSFAKLIVRIITMNF